MFSKTYPTIDPTVKPVMYEIVIIVPDISFKGVETFSDDIIIGNDPAKPLDKPSAVVKINAVSSPPIVGFFRGATQSSKSGINSARSVDIKTNCRRDHEYRTAANSFPITSAVLKVNINKTGIHVLRLHDLISDSNPGYKLNVTQYAKAIHVMYGKIDLATLIRSSKPSLILRKLLMRGGPGAKICSTL